MAMKGHKPGGGIASNKRVEVGYRQGSQRRPANKTGVAQLGQRVGDHITEHGATGYGGVPVFDGGAGFKSKLGNEWSSQVRQGPGKSATAIYKQGQQQSGAVRSIQQGRDILSEYGPNSRAVKR
jgi:hypothetical protein